MEYKRLEEQDLALMENVLRDDHMLFDKDRLRTFLQSETAHGFIAKEKEAVIGFAYGYSLLRPDGRTMFYLHSIGILPAYQDQGYGTGLLAYVKRCVKEMKCAKMFLITNMSNPRACHVYEKLCGENDHHDDIIYVYHLE